MRKLLAFLLLFALPAVAQNTAAIDKTVTELLAKSGAPSASVAVVNGGKLAYVRAYGNARVEPPLAATPEMRYSIGSISKQFTAAAVLLLAEEGKLSLDDKVVRWLPELTRASDVTIRQLLSMTSGYQDFWPQDYVMPMMMKDVATADILNGWAKKPLDFEPGAKWQYSNTNYVVAGVIVERVAGMPLLDFLQKRIFAPLGMTSVTNSDEAALGPNDPMRYQRFALAPVRPAPKEGRGWMFAAGELAMTASDLAKWDIAMIEQKILSPQSFRELEREVQLNNGIGTRYGLGVSVGTTDGRRIISHGGEVSGFTARNDVYVDDGAAVVVLTNLDATNASEQIATAIGKQLFATSDSGTQAALDTMKRVFEGLQRGQIDRSLFTSNANAYFSADAVKDFAASLGPLGKVQEFTQSGQSLRGGMTLRRYRIKLANQALRLTTFIMPDGKIEEYQISAAE
ncbi:MAG TPA: serine hydrolase domain-containing protein [Thermoanaerobaculia bacterium]|nr:serine hydrolase domain-containing protein [Thermoanaerobaculia bacterium]